MNQESTPLSEDRRCAPRLTITLQVEISWPGGGISAYSVDLSPSGLFVETVEPLPVDESLGLLFWVVVSGNRKLVEARGKVARQVSTEESRATGHRPGFGIHYEAVSLGEEDLQAFVAQRIEAMGAPLPELTPEPEPLPEQTRVRRRHQTGLQAYWGESADLDKTASLSGLSSTGAFLETDERPAPDTPVLIWFELPLEGKPLPVRLAARVVGLSGGAASGRTGMIVRFDGPATDLANVKLFVEGRLNHEAALTRESWRYHGEKSEATPSSSPLPSHKELPPQRATGLGFDWQRTLPLIVKLVGAVFLLYLLALASVGFFR